jgi:hypothetical protein
VTARLIAVQKSAYMIDPTSSEFLLSFEWRKLRMRALKKYGPWCMCCGDSPASGAVMNVDHIKPRKLFPKLSLDINNLQVLCAPCNHGKGNWDQTDWRKTHVASQAKPKKPRIAKKLEVKKFANINTLELVESVTNKPQVSKKQGARPKGWHLVFRA